MREDYLHYVWKTHKWPNTELRTTRSEILEITDRGSHNRDQGPDFHMASIRLSGMEWHGHIEMHVRSSDWNRHRHSADARYQNVILHVVWEHDTEVVCNGRTLPTLELREYLTGIEMERYAGLFENRDDIPCSSMLRLVPPPVTESQIAASGVDRLIDKTDRLLHQAQVLHGDWEALYYQLICRYLMTPPNAQAMDMLTAKVPWKLVAQNQKEQADLEALFFGCSGLLPSEAEDDYILELRQRFVHLRQLYGLHTMNRQSWYFLRLRPAHFPTLRIAQLCGYFANRERPLAEILDCSDLKAAESLLAMHPSPYWREHYQFGRSSAGGSHSLGTMTRNVLLINVVIPLVYAYGEFHHRPVVQDMAIRWMEGIAPENNRCTRMWRTLGLKARSAVESQALLNLHDTLCSQKKCLDCRIGHHILSKNPVH